MAESAFGVEHGEVSKAFGNAFKPKKLGQEFKSAAGATKQAMGGQKKRAGQFSQGTRSGLGGAKLGGTAGTVGAPKQSSFNSGLRFGGGLRQNRKAIGYGVGGTAAGGGVGYGLNDGRKKNGQIS